MRKIIMSSKKVKTSKKLVKPVKETECLVLYGEGNKCTY